MGYITAMRSVLFSAASLGPILGLFLSVSPARAVPGEKHYVGSEFALVREEPYGAAAVVATIPEGQAVVEITRQQNWLQVGVVRKGITGWIHISFLDTERDTHQEPLIPPMRKFRPAFDTFNAMKAADGEPPFTSATDRGNRVLLVSATTAWWSHPLGRKRNDLTSLHQMWQVANDQLPVVVVIRDPTGKRQLKRADHGPPAVPK